MANKIKETSFGTIEYRLPNIVEGMRMLSKLGLKRDGSAPAKDEFELMADMIEAAKPFVVCIKAGEDVWSWEDALSNVACAAPLLEIASEAMNSLNGDEARKK